MRKSFWKKVVILDVLFVLLFVATAFTGQFPAINGLDAVVEWDNGKAYFFKGSQYSRYDMKSDRTDPGYPKQISNETWPGVPWHEGIDAAVNWGNGKVYFFKGGEYVRYDVKADRVDPGYPKPINSETWPGLPWRDGVDAVVNWYNGKVYFFRGGEYVRYDVKADRVDPGYPKSLSNWSGVPWPDGVDAAANWKNGKVYFFKRNSYVRFDVKSDRVDSGYPKPISDETWPGLSSLFR
jgi:matrix metalloproteinase-14 (membrane-inserted)